MAKRIVLEKAELGRLPVMSVAASSGEEGR